jgi:hypothetical protein
MTDLLSLDNYKGFSFSGIFEFPATMPFLELINHSDCDGELNYGDCLELNEDFINHSEKLNDYIMQTETNIETKEHTAKIRIDYTITDSAFNSSDFILSILFIQ